MDKYDISVIIPTYKRRYSLKRLLDSFVQATYNKRQFEVIVVDDQSGEDISRLVNQFRDILNVSLLTSRIKERAGARNTGAEASKGDILIFLDDDMELKPGFIEGHLNAHEKWPNAVVVGRIDSACDQNSIWNDLVDRRFDLMKKHVSRSLEDLPFTCTFTGNLSVKKNNFNKIGGFDDKTFGYYGGEDFDFGIRAKAFGIRIVYAEEASALHHEDRMVRKKFMAKIRWAAFSMVNLLNKHKRLVLEEPAMTGFPCSLPGVYTPGGKSWKEMVKKILKTPPVTEAILWLADSAWRFFSKSGGMKLARVGNRFYYERHLCHAVEKIWQMPANGNNQMH